MQTNTPVQRKSGWESDAPLQATSGRKQQQRVALTEILGPDYKPEPMNETKMIYMKAKNPGMKFTVQQLQEVADSRGGRRENRDHEMANADIISQLKAAGSWTTNTASVTTPVKAKKVPGPIEFPGLGCGTLTAKSNFVPSSHSVYTRPNRAISMSPSPIQVFPTWVPMSDLVELITPEEEMDDAFEDWEYDDDVELAKIERAMNREYARMKDYLPFTDPEEFLDIEFEHDDWFVPVNRGPKHDFCGEITGDQMFEPRFLLGAGSARVGMPLWIPLLVNVSGEPVFP